MPPRAASRLQRRASALAPWLRPAAGRRRGGRRAAGPAPCSAARGHGHLAGGVAAAELDHGSGRDARPSGTTRATIRSAEARRLGGISSRRC